VLKESFASFLLSYTFRFFSRTKSQKLREVAGWDKGVVVGGVVETKGGRRFKVSRQGG
jgi:hypothetical protein